MGMKIPPTTMRESIDNIQLGKLQRGHHESSVMESQMWEDVIELVKCT
jgi:hypothetical protein